METVLLHKSAFLYVTSIFRLSSFVFANALLTGITKTFVPFYSSFPEICSNFADETKKLQEAIINISSFGYDYNSMTEDQQYALGSYVNLMNSATQLLVNPILGLQPNYTDSDLSDFISWNVLGRSLIIKSDKYKSLIVYLVNLFWAIQVDDSDMKLFINSLKKNKDFLTEMGLSKDELDEKLIKYIQEAIRRKKNQMKD